MVIFYIFMNFHILICEYKAIVSDTRTAPQCYMKIPMQQSESQRTFIATNLSYNTICIWCMQRQALCRIDSGHIPVRCNDGQTLPNYVSAGNRPICCFG